MLPKYYSLMEMVQRQK